MAAIDLIVLGMLKNKPMSAYDLQKLVEYRNISRWVKISTPSIYKKVLQLEDKGFISGTQVKEGKMPEKSVYTITKAGEDEFLRLMYEISDNPLYILFDFNAVIVNLESLPPEKQGECIAKIEHNVNALKSSLEANIAKKEGAEDVPQMGMEVLRQQYVLAQTIEKWLGTIKRSE